MDGRTTDVLEADGSSESAQFDLEGNEVASALGTQAATTKLVNVLGWTLRTNEFDGSVTRNVYDALGHLVKADVNGLVSLADYDGQGRVARQVNPDGSTAVYAYDCFGRSTGSVESSGSAVVRTTTTSYDSAGHDATSSVVTSAGVPSSEIAAYAADGLTTATRVSRSGVASVTTVTDGAGALRSLLARFAGTSLDFSVATTDSAGRVVSTTSNSLPIARACAWTQAGQLAQSRAGTATADYTYSPISGRKTHDSRHLAFGSRDEASDYGYDLAGRLVSASFNGTTTSYEYDPQSGALLGVKRGVSATSSLSYETSGTGRLVAAGARRYQSDSRGRRVAAGTGTNPNETSYVWMGDRLAGITWPTGSATYSYDSSGQRVRSAVTSAGVTTTTDYDYEDNRLVGLSANRSDGATWTVDYIFDGSGQLYAGVYAGGDATPTPFLVDTSDRGDVRELLDASGAAFAMYCYDAYGVCTEMSSAGTAKVPATTAAFIAARQPLRYAAYTFDSESGLYYCLARYYDPSVGAFISKDPQRADGEGSPYQYCAGDPVGRTDPSGTMFLSLHHQDEFEHARAKLIAAATQLVKWNVGYSHGAHVQRPKKNGQMDCSGAVAWIFRKAGTWFNKHIPDPTSSSRWNTDSFVEHLSWRTKHWSQKQFYSGRPWQVGDVLVRGWSGGKMGHIVMVVRDGGSPKLFECAGSARGQYREGARFIPIATRLNSWTPTWAGRFFDYEPKAPYGGRI
ncbi:MAG: RHS repeat-associated core domain-containing protein [Coriobacteriia bacterium]|nr:RHS repeat-associated core domain-containing protein [Coriobacteriia bacterium]